MMSSGPGLDSYWFSDVQPWPGDDSFVATEIAGLMESSELTSLLFQDAHLDPQTSAQPEPDEQEQDDLPAAQPGLSPPEPEDSDTTLITTALTPASRRRTPHRRRRPLTPPKPKAAKPANRRRRPLIAAGVVAAVVIAGVVTATALSTGGEDRPTESVVATDKPSDTPTAGSVAVTSPPPAAPTNDPADCVPTVSGPRTVGNGPGDQDSGPGVIQAFEYAYYVKRDAVLAWSYIRGNIASKPPTLQQSIDAVPVGTQHCLMIDDRGGGLYALKIAVAEPGQPVPQVIPQLVQTTAADGKTWITSIVKDES